MRYLFCLFFVLSGSYAFGEDCKTPVAEVGLRRIFEDLPWNYTVITYKSFSPTIQWLGLYWEGPISGALMACNCEGKFLSGVKTGGVETLQCFYGPRTIGPTIVTEEIYTGTGSVMSDMLFIRFRITRSERCGSIRSMSVSF